MRGNARLWTIVAILAGSGISAMGEGSNPAADSPDLPCDENWQPRTKHKRKFGPPPPGYWKITSDPVPHWRPEDMLRPRPRVLTWQPLGPRPIENEYWSGDDRASGRVIGIAPHPSNANICYIASASGGVWKTTNGGVNWTPLTDQLSILNNGAITLKPGDPNTIYVGTGEYQTSSGGDGLFRSTDAGATWAQVATSGQVGLNCSRVLVDSAFTSRLHVTSSLGYSRSEDNGVNWTTLISGTCSDMAINPLNTAVLYVAKRNDGVYKSTNKGDTWTKLTSGLPAASINRIVLAIAPSDPNYVYAAFATGGNLEGLYRTTNAGTSWTKLVNTPNFPSPQASYDMCLGVDPTNRDIVYAGGVFPSYAVAGVIKTTNGGTSWTDITISATLGQLHPDQHALVFGPGSTLWVGNDGGVWKSTNGGSTWINCNATLTVTQNYNIALHPTDPNQIMGGTQDNGTVGRELTTDAWPQLVSGDGGFLVYDPNLPDRRYTTYVYLDVFRFTVIGGVFDDITGPWGGDSANFIAPLVMAPSNPNILVGGTNRVWRTTNATANPPTWTDISGTVVSGGGTINTLAVARTASNTIYSGSSNGLVYVTTNASTWNNRSTGLPSGIGVADLEIDPNNAAVGYVVFRTTTGPRVFRTDNTGVSWSDKTGNLPLGVRAKTLAVDWRFSPPDLYLGSGAGVYRSRSGGASWVKEGGDLPNVNIGELVIDRPRNTLTAGTYGRGAWRRALPACRIAGDVDADGDVDQDDLDLLLFYFGVGVEGDADGDGDTDQDDLDLVLFNFGTTC